MTHGEPQILTASRGLAVSQYHEMGDGKKNVIPAVMFFLVNSGNMEMKTESGRFSPEP